jgi:NADH-quinone oxidoreductase subunit N
VNLELIIPELTLAVFAGVVIIADTLLDEKRLLAQVSLSALVISAGVALAMWGGSLPALFNNMLAVDNFAIFFKLLFLGIAFLVILASMDYVEKHVCFQGEYYALVLLATLGMMLMAASADLISIYVALELTSISICALICLLKDAKSTEASLKYILLAAISSAVMLYGMALIFGFTGKTQLSEIARVIQTMPMSNLVASPALMLGIVLLVAGFGFKIAAVPFQMWIPDVYEGAPTPITAYLSVASKAAGFAVIMRVFFTSFGNTWLSMNWGIIFAVLSAISMTIGNVVALPQSNIKRLFGYSSIAQAGYLMVGLATMGFSAASDVTGRSSIIFFLTAYAFTNLGAFIAIIAISNKLGSDLIDDYAGMGRKAPLVALALTLCLVSLIGIPPAAGFIAKFFIFSAAVKKGLLWLVIIAVINSVISAYYYLRVVKVMWVGEASSREKLTSTGVLSLGLLIAALGVLLLGILPTYVMRLAEIAARIFTF